MDTQRYMQTRFITLPWGYLISQGGKEALSASKSVIFTLPIVADVRSLLYASATDRGDGAFPLGITGYDNTKIIVWQQGNTLLVGFQWIAIYAA